MAPRHPPHTVPPFVINLFFAIGLISAFAFRVIIVFAHVKPEWFRPVWYVGIVGYLLFFLYRYVISQKRRRAVDDYRLIDKLSRKEALSDEERQVLIYLLSSIKKSRENINYLVIFALSFLAVVLDCYLSFRGW